jgi:MFS family permease
MTAAMVAVVVTTVLLNAMDGFDILSIAFASPGIAAEWGIDQLELGIVLSMELIGMAFGSVFLGRLADQIGRRPTLLGCLAVMAAGMLLATTAGSAVSSPSGASSRASASAACSPARTPSWPSSPTAGGAASAFPSW